MSRTLNFVDCLLARGRQYQEQGCTNAALNLLTRVSGLRTLTAETAIEVHARLAELHLRNGEYGQARRHLAVALAAKPRSAELHYCMALAFDQDEESDPQEACHHYRTSLKIEPNQPNCLSDFGLLILSFGETDEGLKALRKAVKLAPDDPEILGKLIEGLCELDQTDEARKTLQAARFRNSHDDRFRQLWTDFQYQQLYAGQDSVREAHWRYPTEEQPRVLPFVRPARRKTSRVAKGKVIRQDGPSTPAPPHRPRVGGPRRKTQA
jgi:Tfp pilus assembly protein PilF